jgi:hypothetical protein
MTDAYEDGIGSFHGFEGAMSQIACKQIKDEKSMTITCLDQEDISKEISTSRDVNIYVDKICLGGRSQARVSQTMNFKKKFSRRSTVRKIRIGSADPYQL